MLLTLDVCNIYVNFVILHQLFYKTQNTLSMAKVLIISHITKEVYPKYSYL